MITSKLMGPGWLMFFQETTFHGNFGYTDIINGKKRREENEILLWLMTAYETGVFR